MDNTESIHQIDLTRDAQTLLDILDSKPEILVLLGAGASYDCGFVAPDNRQHIQPKLQRGFLSDFPRWASMHPWLTWAFIYLLSPHIQPYSQDLLVRQIERWYPIPNYLRESEEDIKSHISNEIPFAEFELEEVTSLLEAFSAHGVSAPLPEMALKDLRMYIDLSLPNPINDQLSSTDAPCSLSPAYKELLIWLYKYATSRICTYNYDTLLDYESFLLQQGNAQQCSHYLGRLAIQYGEINSRPILECLNLNSNLINEYCIPKRAQDPRFPDALRDGRTPHERIGAITSSFVRHAIYKPHGSLDEYVCRDAACRSYLKPINAMARLPGLGFLGNIRCPDCRAVLEKNISLPIADKYNEAYPKFKADITDVSWDMKDFVILCIGYSFPDNDWGTKAMILNAVGSHADTWQGKKVDVVVVNPDREAHAAIRIQNLLRESANVSYVSSGFSDFTDLLTRSSND